MQYVKQATAMTSRYMPPGKLHTLRLNLRVIFKLFKLLAMELAT